MIAKSVSFASIIDGGLEVSGDVNFRSKGGLGSLKDGDVVYCDEDVIAKMPHLATALGGTVIGQPGRVMGATVGGVRLLSYGVWGVNSRKGLEQAAMDCMGAGIPWHTTSAATVAALSPSSAALAPRWRGAMQAALHAGPIIHATAGGNGIHIDRVSAYLQSMDEPMPGSGAWTLDRPRVSRAANDRLSIVYARVKVKETARISAIPPLPVHASSGGLLYPVGEFDGVWSGPTLRRAVDAGEAEILAVRWRIRACGSTTAYRDMADKIRGIPKRTGKAIYTRLWGKMLSRGGMLGTKDRRPGTYLLNGLWWGRDERNIWDPRMPRHYRPDIAMFIVSRNGLAMVEAERQLSEGSTIATHVDSIWTTDTSGAENVLAGGGWSEKGRGKIRFVGAGRYFVDDGRGGYWGHAGSENCPTTVQELARDTGRGNLNLRGWYGDPRIDEHARSVPPDIGRVESMTKLDGYPPDSPIWKDGAWLPQHTVTTLRGGQ